MIGQSIKLQPEHILVMIQQLQLPSIIIIIINFILLVNKITKK